MNHNNNPQQSSNARQSGDSTADVLIVGGGIIGAACAWELAQRGLRVTVIDKGEMGHGCSYGNAGWLTHCFALPLPMPGMFLKSLGWLLDPESPLYIKPRANWELVNWLWRFMRSMNGPLSRQSIAALVALSRHGLEAYERLARESTLDVGFERRGVLMVSNTVAGIDAAVEEMQLVAGHGVVGRRLSGDEIREMEPAVIATGTLGGVFFPNEAHLRPLEMVQSLCNRCAERGVTFLPRTEVIGFETQNRRVSEVVTTRGRFRAEQIVLAAGAWSGEVARTLRLRIPMMSGKGYSLTVEPFEPAPRIPIMIVEKKIAITPLAGGTKLAGTLELVGLDESITRRRVEAIVRGARQFLNLPQTVTPVELWRGLRPCTPDGVPIIGRSEHFENLFLATGHQMLGLQMAPATGRLLADLMQNVPPPFDPYPFRARRFGV